MQRQPQPGEPGYEEWLKSQPPAMRRMVPVRGNVANAMQRDPRFGVSQGLVQNAASTAPAYGAADGLSRVIGGIAGGLMQKKLGQNYVAQEDAANAKQREGAMAMAKSMGINPTTLSAFGDNPEGLVAAALMAGRGGAQGGMGGAPGGMTPPMQPPMPSAPNLAAAGGPQGAPPNPMQPPVVNRGPMNSTPTSAPASGGSAGLTNPFSAFRVTSDMSGHRGRGSSGVDYGAPEGTPIVAPEPFEVIKSWTDARGGNSARIRFADGTVMGIAHLKEPVKVQRGGAGEVIGFTGNTGKSSGPHAHVRTWDPSGKEVDPQSYLTNGKVPAAQPAATAQPAQQGPQQPITTDIPDPEMPDRPELPDAGKAVPSYKLRMGLALLKSGDPYLQEEASRMLDEGMAEQFSSDQNLETRGYELRRDQFKDASANYYDAQGDKRRDTYAKQNTQIAQRYGTSEREASQRYGTSEREASQRFTTAERLDSQTFQKLRDEANNQARMNEVNAQITGRAVTAEQRRQARMEGFFQSPSGSKLRNDVQNAIMNNNSMISMVEQFLAINEKEGTGDLLSRFAPSVSSSVHGWRNDNFQQMEALTEKMAPLMRQAGSGAMSDKDVEMYRKSVPNISAGGKANAANGAVLIRGLKRQNDFEINRMQAASAMEDVQFTKEWSAFTKATSIMDGKDYVSFEDWKRSLPTVGRDGKAK